MPHKRIKSIPFHILAPNLVTVLAMAAGITSIRLSAQGKWELAIIAIFLAAVFDGLDGRIARLLKASTKFGAELDSLSDFVSFGVAPAMLLYFWSLSELKGIGWVLCATLAISCSLRLARFNVMLESDPMPKYWQHFFVGMPAPAAAISALLPLLFYYSLGFNYSFLRMPIITGTFALLISIMMVSKIPTICLKKLHIPAPMLIPMMLIFALTAGFMVNKPFATASVLTSIYLLSLPVGFYLFLKEKKKYLSLNEENKEDF